MEFGPLSNEPLRTRWKRPPQDRAGPEIDTRDVARVTSMKVRRSMIGPEHRDHDSVELADSGHASPALTVGRCEDPSVPGRQTLCVATSEPYRGPNVATQRLSPLGLRRIARAPSHESWQASRVGRDRDGLAIAATHGKQKRPALCRRAAPTSVAPLVTAGGRSQPGAPSVPAACRRRPSGLQRGT